MHFKDKVVWITGASSGIGAELALQLSAQVARIIITLRNEEALLCVQKKWLIHTSFYKIVTADLSFKILAENTVKNVLKEY